MLLDEGRQAQMSTERPARECLPRWPEISKSRWTRETANSGAITNTPLQRKVKHRNGSTLRLRTHY